MSEPIFKILQRQEWEAAQVLGRYPGSVVDQRDGFIHFSSHHQVRATALKHFAGQTDLLVLWVNPNYLGVSLKWEAARGGELFPHLYTDLPLAAVEQVMPWVITQDQFVV